MKRSFLATTALCAAAYAHEADARSFRLNQIPNNPAQCLTCHTSFGGSARDAFGLDVEANLTGGSISSADVDWSAIFNLDSDGDGFSNGEELGDPDGTWTIGDPSPSGPFYDPGDATDFPRCGNDVIDPVNDELCDGADLGDATCVSEGFTGGNLACSGTCTLDTSACTSEPPADAGVPDAAPDATLDAGAPDQGSADTGTPEPDASTGGPDAGVAPADAGGGGSEPDDGGCQAVGGSALVTWLLVAAPLALRRRRR